LGKLRVGIVGCGRVASEFEDRWDEHPASIAGAFASLEETVLVAAANRGQERLTRFGKRWGVSALYLDYREMLSRERPDIVAVATHPPLHPEIVEAACAAGAQGIFCEKPMALDLEGCDRIVRATERHGVRLLVNCSRRFSGLHEAVRLLTRRGDLGELLHLVGHCQGAKPVPEWEAATEGPLLHDAVHLMDLMRFYAGDAESLVATASSPTHRFRVEDTSTAVIRFPGGVEGVAVVDEMAEYADFSLELDFTRGRVRLGSFAQGLWRSVPVEGGENGWWQQLAPAELPPPAWQGTSMLNAARNLVDAVLGGASIRCDARDGRASVELIMAIYASEAQGGSRVRLPLPAGPSALAVLRDRGIL
jgi:UDP-N-acetyl-2-amino-2-deoxyglucuronate dehydrogenase